MLVVLALVLVVFALVLVMAFRFALMATGTAIPILTWMTSAILHCGRRDRYSRMLNHSGVLSSLGCKKVFIPTRLLS